MARDAFSSPLVSAPARRRNLRRPGPALPKWPWLRLLLCGLASCAGNLASAPLAGVDDGDVGSTGVSVNTAASPVEMRRLLKRELMASLNDLVGATPSVQWSAIANDVAAANFDNDVDSQSVNTTEVEGYLAIASQAANDAVPATGTPALLGCGRSGVNQACMTAFIASFGERIYRRPLTAEEGNAYLTLWSTETSANDGARQVVRAFLAAPEFLYQPEVGVAAKEKPGYVRLTGYERATRLALLLTGSVPSDDLLAQAKNGDLDDAEGVSAAAQKLLDTAQGQAYLRYFAVNWLNVNASVGTQVSPLGLANDSAALHQDMAEETLKLFDDFARPGTKLSGIFTADYTYVTAAIAPIYGVTAPASGTWSKVSLTGQPRLGFLTQPNFLYITNSSGPLAVGRGKYVRQRLMCQSIGSPPSNVANIELSTNGNTETERQALSAHSADASCWACHQLMDPVGFGFEQYDQLGNYNAKAANGTTLTGAGEVSGTGGFSFTGPVQLSQQLASMATIQACMGQKLAQYVLGHVPTDDDAGTVALLNQKLLQDDLVAALVAFAGSDAFLYRKIPSS